MMNRKFFHRFCKSILTFTLLFLNVAPTVVQAGELVSDTTVEVQQEVAEEESEDPLEVETEDTESISEDKVEDDLEVEDLDTEESSKDVEELVTVEEKVEDSDSKTSAVSTQAIGITQENLVYEAGKVKLINQTEGENIAAVLPNGKLINKPVPYHGTWEPLQIIAPDKVYPGDKLEIFTFEGNVRGESVFLTVEGEGEERPEDQSVVKYGRQAFSFIPTVSDKRVGYKTDPFFTVEVTFPTGEVFTQVASVLGQTSFEFPDGYTPRPGQIFSARVFDREENELDLDNSDLFNNGVKNEKTTKVHGKITDYQITIDPNGGTIADDAATTLVELDETYTVPSLYKSKLDKEGYTITGYAVEGTLLDKDGEVVTEIPSYSREYTPQSDVTLTAIWEETTGKFTAQVFDDAPGSQKERYTVKLVSEDGTEYELSSTSWSKNYREWSVKDVPNGTYTLVIDGYDVSEGEKFGQPDTESNFEVNEDGTATVDLKFADNKGTTFIRYKVYGEETPYTVTIDPDGGTIKEEFEETKVKPGENFKLPYAFQSGLAKEGYTLIGYTVEGTLLDKDGNEVTEISRYLAEYTPMSDVTLTANWEVTSGKFTVLLFDDVPATQPDRYTLTLVSEDGEEFELSSSQYGPNNRTWAAENVPNGDYTLVINGFDISAGEKQGHPDTESNFVVNDDGTATVALTFKDDAPSTFIRYRVYGEETPEEIDSYFLGLEIRDLDNKRTDEVAVTVTNEDDEVFTGSYNEYKQWLTDEAIPAGTYTITLDTPEGTVAEINDTVATQRAVATDEDNVFTIEVNAETQGNLSAVYGAFRLVEVGEEPEDPDNGKEDPEDEDDDQNGNNDSENPEDGEKEKPSDNGKEESDDEDLPQTGEAVTSMFAGTILLLSGLGLISVPKFKRNKKDK